MKNRRTKDQEKLQGINLLANLIRRLRSIDQYIQQEDYGYYQVTYEGTKLNFCDLFSRADAFNALPIISEVEGSLGESTDYIQGSKAFVNGLKLKLNGSVADSSGEMGSQFSSIISPCSNPEAKFTENERQKPHRNYICMNGFSRWHCSTILSL